MKILIANRGEIALRIMKVCEELNYSSVIIYTEHDQDSLPVKLAKEKYKVNNYLNMEEIIEIAKQSDVEAIHPGYGFLSENYEFAKLCEDNGIKFIGPSFEVIKKLGNKIEAKKFVESLGIQTLPSYLVNNLEEAKIFSRRIGFPVILKAVGGGGGKGIRVVKLETELPECFQSVKNEAQIIFNNSGIYLEKYLEDPRHIEFQILADNFGNVIHLGERECSIQRRHQKLIEETPSTALTEELRKQMAEAAVKIAKEADYVNAGSVEFLFKDKKFYFMEMNTRLQVEHGITEMITNVDLVKEQIKIADNQRIPAYVKFDGWAIECRINAESPKTFLPSVGKIITCSLPKNVRVDSALEEGTILKKGGLLGEGIIISPYYDSMIAKLIIHGKTREEAIEKTKKALSEFVIEGIETTISFHQETIKHPDFISGNTTTGFINKNLKKETNMNNKTKEIIDNITNSVTNSFAEDKVVIISAALAYYLKSKSFTLPEMNQNNLWIITARQDGLSNTLF